jgi:hypothetical protein
MEDKIRWTYETCDLHDEVFSLAALVEAKLLPLKLREGYEI